MSKLQAHDRTPFVTVYRPIAGWKAVLYWWNPEMGGFWEPYQTSEFAFQFKSQAEIWAKGWAQDEGIRYVESKEEEHENAA